MSIIEWCGGIEPQSKRMWTCVKLIYTSANIQKMLILIIVVAVAGGRRRWKLELVSMCTGETETFHGSKNNLDWIMSRKILQENIFLPNFAILRRNFSHRFPALFIRRITVTCFLLLLGIGEIGKHVIFSQHRMNEKTVSWAVVYDYKQKLHVVRVDFFMLTESIFFSYLCSFFHFIHEFSDTRCEFHGEEEYSSSKRSTEKFYILICTALKMRHRISHCS